MIGRTTIDKEGRAKTGAVILVPKDYVQIVRCKNCKWWELIDDYYAKGYGECTCPISVIKRSTFLNENWYCADGERKEE